MLSKRTVLRTVVLATTAVWLMLPGIAGAQNQTPTLSPVLTGGNLPYQIRVPKLRLGSNTVRFRGVNLNGIATPPKNVTIVRK